MNFLVIGCVGAGKSYLAQELSAHTKIKVYHLDNYFWQPNWEKTNSVSFIKSIQNIQKLDSWIIDGLYLDLFNELDNMHSDDLIVVYLNTKRLVSIYRVVKRTFFRIITKELVCNNNIETIKNLFGKESIISYAIKTYRNSKDICEQIIEKYPNAHVISNRKDIKEFVKKFSQ